MKSDFTVLFLRYPIIIIIFIIGYIVPFLSKKNIFFGARIPNEFFDNPRIEQLKRDYKHLYMVVMIPIVIVLMFLLFSISNDFIVTLGVVLQTLLIFNLYALFNHKVKKVKLVNISNDAEKEQMLFIDTNFREGKYLVSLQWFLPSIAVVLLNMIFINTNFNRIPALIPTSFDLSGKVSQFVTKTGFNVYNISLISIFNLLVFLGVYYVIKRSKQDLNSSHPKKAVLQDRQFRYLWSGYSAILSFLLSVYFSLIALHVDRLFILSDELFTIINIAFPNVILISTIFLAIKTGQSGSRLKINTGEEEVKSNFVDDDINWKLGMIYYNPDDPAIFIPKRMGVGWTLNFGHPVSFVLIGAIIVLPMIMKNFSH